MHFDKSILQFPSAVLQKSPGRQSFLAFFVVAFVVVVDVSTVVVVVVGVGVTAFVVDFCQESNKRQAGFQTRHQNWFACVDIIVGVKCNC